MKKISILCLLSLILCSCASPSNAVVEIEMELYCEKGEVYGSRCKIVENAEPEVTCPEGFPYNENLKTCANIISVSAPGKYVCKEGYKLTSGKCVSEKTYEKENGKCPEGTSTYNGECKEIKYRSYEYHCPTGTLNGKLCEFADEKKPEITCPEGYNVNQKEVSCEKITYVDAVQREVQK